MDVLSRFVEEAQARVICRPAKSRQPGKGTISCSQPGQVQKSQDVLTPLHREVL